MTWQPSIRELEFGSLLSYTPRPESDDPNKLEQMRISKNVMSFLKNDRIVQVGGRASADPIPMTEYVAQLLQEKLTNVPFSDFFRMDVVLVPVPRSSLTRSGGLWVPERIAEAILAKNLAIEIDKCLIRVTPLNKSAWSVPIERPSPSAHYESFAVQSRLQTVRDIVLVDDIVTRGHTLLGAANKLHDAFPGARIRAFAVMRTISNPHDFEGWLQPVKGKIVWRWEGDTIRRP